MTNVEMLQGKLDRLTAFNSAVTSLQTKVNTSLKLTKKAVLGLASEVFPSDWRMYALKNTKANDIVAKLDEICNRTLSENADAIHKLSLQIETESKGIEERTVKEETTARLTSIIDTFLLTESYPARELECLYALVDSGEITTEEQLAEYGVMRKSPV